MTKHILRITHMNIYLIRHAESLANIGTQDPLTCGDAYIGLSDLGKDHARAAGKSLGHDLVKSSLIYCSPYTRTRETLACLLEGAKINTRTGMTIYEDPRLREVERGYADEAAQQPLRERHGWFYYRHTGGESAADCYDRTSAFLESLMRQVKRNPINNVLIICHGMTLRCFVMRFLHLTVEQFENMRNPDNGAIVTLAPSGSFERPQFQNGNWEVEGLKLRSGNKP